MQPTVNQYTPYTQTAPVNPANRPVQQAPASNVQAQQQPTPQPQQPTASVGAVQIYINNPTVSAGGYAPYQQSPIAQPNTALAGQPVKDQFVPRAKAAEPAPAASTQPAPVAPAPQVPAQNNLAAQNINPEKKDEVKAEEKPKKQVIPLTKEYIMTLENYIKNENPEIRMMGIKELLKRFKEDDSRKTSQALTNLLNYALQDDDQKIRLYALMILDAGYARGDDFTYKLLTDMQKSDKVFNQDAMTASQILLKRAGDNNLEYSKESQQEKDIADLREFKQVKDSKDFGEYKDYKAVKNSKEFKEYKDNKAAQAKAAEEQQNQSKEPEVGKRLNFLAG